MNWGEGVFYYKAPNIIFWFTIVLNKNLIYNLYKLSLLKKGFLDYIYLFLVIIKIFNDKIKPKRVFGL